MLVKLNWALYVHRQVVMRLSGNIGERTMLVEPGMYDASCRNVSCSAQGVWYEVGLLRLRAHDRVSTWCLNVLLSRGLYCLQQYGIHI